jgi:uncharacterized SAM-binding protein YcdF (DUF218 family)
MTILLIIIIIILLLITILLLLIIIILIMTILLIIIIIILLLITILLLIIMMISWLLQVFPSILTAPGPRHTAQHAALQAIVLLAGHPQRLTERCNWEDLPHRTSSLYV